MPAPARVLLWISFTNRANPAIREKPGADRVYIKSVRTEGTLKAAKQCYHCKPGQYSKAGAAKCETCPANTFSKKGDADNCKSCPYHQMSLPGATECTKSTNCTLEVWLLWGVRCAVAWVCWRYVLLLRQWGWDCVGVGVL